MNFKFGKRKTKEIISIRPESLQDFKVIADYLEEGIATCVDFSLLDMEIAGRLLDMLMGSCYSLKGSISKMAQNVYMILPNGMETSYNNQE